MASLFCCLAISPLIAQNAATNNSSQEKDTNQIRISTYVDGYLSAFSNDLSQQQFQPFTTVGARDNTFGVNVAQFGIHYTNNSVRGNFIYHDGDIPQATWSSNFNNLQEANMGVKLKKNLWFDMGFFATHIGTESFLPKNNMLSSTAFKTFNEPFYQAGAKLSYQPTDNWYLELWGLNGYNSFTDNNDAKSVGLLVNRDFGKYTSLTYTNLYGRESSDDALREQYRLYQNLYLNQNWNDKIFLTIGGDLGIQTNSALSNANEEAYLYAGVLTLRYQLNKEYSLTTRGEVFNDENGFISGVTVNSRGEIVGIELLGITLGGEYRPKPNAYVRLEGRYAQTENKQALLIENGEMVNDRMEVLFTMGFYLDKAFKL